MDWSCRHFQLQLEQAVWSGGKRIKCKRLKPPVPQVPRIKHWRLKLPVPQLRQPRSLHGRYLRPASSRAGTPPEAPVAGDTPAERAAVSGMSFRDEMVWRRRRVVHEEESGFSSTTWITERVPAAQRIALADVQASIDRELSQMLPGVFHHAASAREERMLQALTNNDAVAAEAASTMTRRLQRLQPQPWYHARSRSPRESRQ